jgi:4-hydroxy-2-oxoheptanedioate aldolase
MTTPSPQRTFRERLRDRAQPIVATFQIIPRIEITEIAAGAGFDAVILDLEHGPFGVEAVSPLAAAAKAAGIASLARVPSAAPAAISAVLDTGVDGVVVPNVASVEVARTAVAAARFAPEGSRGVNPYVRAGGHGTDEGFLRHANEATACILMIEGRSGLDALDEILDLPTLDAVIVGPYDLSAALGVLGETEHPSVIEAVEHVIDRASAKGLGSGAFAPTPRAAGRWLDAGATFVALSVDSRLALDGFAAARAAVAAPGAERPN